MCGPWDSDTSSRRQEDTYYKAENVLCIPSQGEKNGQSKIHGLHTTDQVRERQQWMQNLNVQIVGNGLDGDPVVKVPDGWRCSGSRMTISISSCTS